LRWTGGSGDCWVTTGNSLPAVRAYPKICVSRSGRTPWSWAKPALGFIAATLGARLSGVDAGSPQARVRGPFAGDAAHAGPG
jgi:hypothetical protein